MCLAIRRRSDNIDPPKNVHGILLDKWDIRTIKNEKLSRLSKSLYTKTLSSVFMSRSKIERRFPWCLTLSYNSLEYIFLNDVRN